MNGHEVGYSKGARNEAEFDITPYAKIGETNDLTVHLSMVRWYVFRGSRLCVVKWYFRDVEILGVPENGWKISFYYFRFR